jgi:hypothetical protein
MDYIAHIIMYRWHAVMDVEWEGKGRPGITKGYVLIRVPKLDLVPVNQMCKIYRIYIETAREVGLGGGEGGVGGGWCST